MFKRFKKSKQSKKCAQCGSECYGEFCTKRCESVYLLELEINNPAFGLTEEEIDKRRKEINKIIVVGGRSSRK